MSITTPFKCRVFSVSVLFNEPKLLKCNITVFAAKTKFSVSVLFNEPKLLKSYGRRIYVQFGGVSVLFNEPKLLKFLNYSNSVGSQKVSVLFNEPKLLKSSSPLPSMIPIPTFQCSSTSRNC